MPTLYIYQLSDFLTTGGNITPPDEAGARAAGNPPFQITLAPGATPIAVEITDTDGDLVDGEPVFGELGNSQQLAQALTLTDENGVNTNYNVGDTIRGDYFLRGDATDPAMEIASVSIGSGNSGSNPSSGVISFKPLVPGQTYIFTEEANYNGNQRKYTDFACFADETLIETPDGPVRIDSLKRGDLVMTKDQGPQPVLWIGQRRVENPRHLNPICFAKGVIGNDKPLRVSPNHRMLVEGWKAQLLFATDRILAPAKSLVNGDTIYQQKTDQITYVHILLGQHQLVNTHGIWSESFHLDHQNIGTLDQDQYDEVLEIFPELISAEAMQFGSVDTCLKPFEARVLAS